jgi:hypothetical protein
MILATAAPPAPTAAVEASAAAALRNGATHPSVAATSTASKAGGVSTEPVPAAATPWDFKAGTEWYVCVAGLVEGREGGREGGLSASQAVVAAAWYALRKDRDSLHRSACLGHNLKARSLFSSLHICQTNHHQQTPPFRLDSQTLRLINSPPPPFPTTPPHPPRNQGDRQRDQQQRHHRR